ncbi:Xenobiotic-transporting ATPase protein [Dioscorea alata]|uniref:Xenobiotic-transporting ATPase protein n=1 Tax=Dioscorea alata TaxID=55571 RepID=A0ACB7V5L1_DIOAL|nr:Xenobiotic-transporting ATPase protein [Dioscorea alata]
MVSEEKKNNEGMMKEKIKKDGRSKEEEEDIEEEKKKKKKKREMKRKGGSFFKLFSFADAWDCTLMAMGTVGAFVHGASVPVFFLFFGKLIDVIGTAYLFPSSISNKVSKYSLDFVYLGVVILFSSWIEVACWMYTGERQTAKMRIEYLRSLLNRDMAFFDTETSTGEVITTVTNDIIIIQDAISEKVGKSIHCLSRFVVGFVIGFARIWQISLVTLAIVPVIAISGGIFAYTTTGFAARTRKSYVKAGEIAEEVMGNIRTVQAFVGEEKAVKSYKNALMQTYRFGVKAALAKGLGLGSVYGVLFCSWAMLVWFTSCIVHKRISTGADAFTTMINVFVAGLSLGQAAPHIATILKAIMAAKPILEMVKKNKEKNERNMIGGTLAEVDGHIQLCNVSFSYPSRPGVLIFDGLNLDIPSGKIVALVGGSGSGKSTIISLIERFYEPLSGTVLLDGHDIKNLQLKWLRQQIGLVNQEPTLFAMSIRENIIYGKEDATEEEIAHAAMLSNADTFIDNLPDRYETQVGERGIQLSGGQKQRIALARVIIKNPRILLLDEATSALDAESEKSIQEGLNRVMVGRTTVIVAHRLSTIRSANMIAFVQTGKIAETGTHDELMLNPQSTYASLVQLQEFASLNGLSSVEHCKRLTSFRASDKQFHSFRSDKDSFSIYAPETTEQPNIKTISMRRLYSMAAPDWNLGLFGTLGAFVTGAQMPLFTLGMTQALVAYYKPWEDTQRDIKMIAFLFCGGAVLTLIFHTIQHANFGIMGERLVLRVRAKIFRAILQNEIGWFDDTKHASAMLASQLETDASLLRSIIIDCSATLLHNLGLIITSFIITFILNWRLTLVILATFPLLITANISEQLFLKGFGGNLSKAYLKANMLATEAVSNIRTVASFCLENKVVKLYASELDAPAKRSLLRGHIAGMFYGMSQFCLYSSYALTLWYASVLMSKEIVSFPSVIKTFMVLIVTAFAMAEALALAPDIIRGNQMAKSVFELMDRKTEMVSDGGVDAGRVVGIVELKGVKFCYPSRPDDVIFRDLDLRVNSGKTMALVGMSGSGKSTVLALILRFYDPTAGKVMIDGKDIRKFQLSSLREHIGLVQQEPALFATTIYDNILYGKDSASEAEIIEAAKIANAHSFISALPEGYLTKVGERGVQLSGGQKQRIAIARAIIKNPVILLLDEATSALDVESERIVQQALDRVMQTRTTVMVAHRLSTVQNADEISVLEDGKIIEKGSHNSLVENIEGAYYKLINLQQQKN